MVDKQMRKVISKKQREYIKILAGNKCKFCGKSLYKDFHANHKIPYSKKGKPYYKTPKLYAVDVI